VRVEFLEMALSRASNAGEKAGKSLPMRRPECDHSRHLFAQSFYRAVASVAVEWGVA
jgi:hypothetical protein